MKDGMPQKALDQIPIAPKTVTAAEFNARGILYVEKCDYTHAIADFTEAVRLSPKAIPELPALLGGPPETLGGPPARLGDFTAAVKRNPDYAETRDTLTREIIEDYQAIQEKLERIQ